MSVVALSSRVQKAALWIETIAAISAEADIPIGDLCHTDKEVGVRVLVVLACPFPSAAGSPDEEETHEIQGGNAIIADFLRVHRPSTADSSDKDKASCFPESTCSVSVPCKFPEGTDLRASRGNVITA